MYTALDPATEETGAVHLIPGSHKLGCINPSHHSGFLTPEQAEQHCPAEKAITLELLPGDVALLHNYSEALSPALAPRAPPSHRADLICAAIHQSGQNFSDRPRRAYSVNYMDGRTVLNTEAFSANSSGRQSDKAKAAGGLSEGGEDFVRIF